MEGAGEDDESLGTTSKPAPLRDAAGSLAELRNIARWCPNAAGIQRQDPLSAPNLGRRISPRDEMQKMRQLSYARLSLLPRGV